MGLRVDDIRFASQLLTERLRTLQVAGGFWTGQLSNSALSTATAISALAMCLRERKDPCQIPEDSSQQAEPQRLRELIDRGAFYLSRAQNSDGGFGDTDRSHSNIATTLLVIAAWRLAGKETIFREHVLAAEAYVERQGSWEGLRRRYGKDKTFVVPILSNCALAGMVSWGEVSPLPFEAAALPQAWYRFARMPVVSYAIPALVAIGQSRFFHMPPRNPLIRSLRRLALGRTRQVLRNMQPDSGGYLEATPLTSFVLMNLASIGLADSPVAIHCQRFITDSVQADGSWPIDTNLATWVTSLAIHGLLQRPHPPSLNGEPEVVLPKTIDWLLSCQHRVRHPFTGAEPGGWGWTDLSGAVPDADDTPAALLALHAWHCQRDASQTDLKGEPLSIDRERPISADGCLQSERILQAVNLGIQWLLKLQNRDGGWPTFCRGWGKLPFDRSGADLTAHAIRALVKWSDEPFFTALKNTSGPTKLPLKSIQVAIRRGLAYLFKQQRADGSWLPLWFGNQDRPGEENPIYGTGRVLLAFGDLASSKFRHRHLTQDAVIRATMGIEYLLTQQNTDGGWGGGDSTRYPVPSGNKPVPRVAPSGGESSIEETSVAIEGLWACRSILFDGSNGEAIQEQRLDIEQTIGRAADWLTTKVKNGDCERSQPIGFYFAKLWYHERLYPHVFATAALNRLLLRE